MTCSPHRRPATGKLPTFACSIGFALVVSGAWQAACAQQGDGLPPDASHMPDVETEDALTHSKPEVPALPSWGKDERKLVPRLWPGNPGAPADHGATFVPEIQLPPEVDPAQIPDLYLADYFGQLPETYLVDPQTLLTAHERTSINLALRQHLANHDLPVYILLFQGEQKIPDYQSLESLQKRWFGDRPGVVVGFWLGSPTRTSAYFGHTLRKQFTSRLDAAFAEALGQSYKKTYPFSQLDHFTYTLLWQLGQLEHDAALAAAPPPPTPPAEPVLPVVPEFDAIDPVGWLPIAAGGSAIAVGIAALGAGLIATRRRRERRRHQHVPTILPAAAPADRLNAPHCGGSGALIRIENPLPKMPSNT